MKHWLIFSSDKRISLNPKHINFLRGQVTLVRGPLATIINGIPFGIEEIYDKFMVSKRNIISSCKINFLQVSHVLTMLIYNRFIQ